MPKAEVIKQPIEKISGSLKQSAWIAIAESLATAVLGIFLIAWPEAVIQVLAYVVGIFFVVKGGYDIISYFIVKGQYDFFNNSLLSGIIAILVGITALVMGPEIANIFRIIIGIWMIYQSIVHVNTSIKLYAAKINIWKYVLILALCMAVIGVFITFYTGAVITLIGWLMIVTGIIGIIGDVMFIQYVNTLAETITGKKDE